MNTPNNKRRRESQKKMEQAFVHLFQDREIQQISVTEVCQLAGVNRTTFYANYQDIYALSAAVIRRLEEDILSLYQEEMTQRQASHNFLKLFYHIRDNQLAYKTYFRLQQDEHIHTFGYDVQEAASYFDLKSIDYHIEFFAAGMNAVIRKWLKNNCRETPEEIFAIIQEEYASRRFS